METAKVGKAITYLRKKAGYTQKELADRIGVSDKAVSKWERGLGLPDTSIIGKIAILLDTDTDSLLAGDLIHHNTDWTGLLILRENPQGIGIDTVIYDKPIIYFLLSYFLLMGIREIWIICGDDDRSFAEREFQDGASLGMKLFYSRKVPDGVYENRHSNVMIVAGMSFIYGVDQTRFFQKAMIDREKITVLSLPKKKTGSPARIYYDSDKKIVASEDGEKLNTQYDYYQIPILFCPSEIVSKLKLDETQGISFAHIQEEIYTVILDRGFVEIPINTWNDVMDASLFVKTVQKACGMQIYCIEEIAWRRGLISHEEFYKLGLARRKTPYGEYILDMAKSGETFFDFV